MVQIVLDIKKTAEQNAAVYFEEAKKLKKKIKGAEETIIRYKQKLKELELQKEKEEKKSEEQKIRKQEKEEKSKAEKKWFHKFRWFMSSEGFLVIGGRDATTNEIIIKKYTDKNDLVLHTDLAGSPFIVIKKETSNPGIGKITIEEAAIFCASYSKAWKLNISYADVYYVKPEQVSKEAKPGEYLSKGSFMIYGNKNYLRAEIGLAICETENGVMASAIGAAKEHSINGRYVIIKPGNEKASDAAKQIRKKLGVDRDIDEIIKVLPAGGVRIE